MKKKVLIVGAGAREHALTWKLAQSPQKPELFVAPGNGGTAAIIQNVPMATTDIEGLLKFAKENRIDLTIVGPDDPLAVGIVDRFQKEGLRIFGPTRAAAQIEWSKVFAKNLMRDAGVPTAAYRTFISSKEASAYIANCALPVVVKASGLALGKGVFICKTRGEAEAALRQIMVEKAFKEAGNEVVIEEFLEGPEISMHAFCDGKTAKMLPVSQDHKTIFDNDEGQNTGGMGTIAPLPWVSKETIDEVYARVVVPMLKGLKEQGAPFMGCLYPGLKMTPQGMKVLEFNARFGDPETQVYMRLLKTDLLDIIESCIDGTLERQSIEWHSGFAACIVAASGGYPGQYEKGKEIAGIETAERLDGVVVFHAGTEDRNGKLLTAGGRVLGVTAVADTLEAALKRAYGGMERIRFEGMQYRRDIGAKSLKTLHSNAGSDVR